MMTGRKVNKPGCATVRNQATALFSLPMRLGQHVLTIAMRSEMSMTVRNRLLSGSLHTTCTKWNAHPTARNGITTLHSKMPPIMCGRKTVTKQKTDAGSKLFTLAMLPVPKKAAKM